MRETQYTHTNYMLMIVVDIVSATDNLDEAKAVEKLQGYSFNK